MKFLLYLCMSSLLVINMACTTFNGNSVKHDKNNRSISSTSKAVQNIMEKIRGKFSGMFDHSNITRLPDWARGINAPNLVRYPISFNNVDFNGVVFLKFSDNGQLSFQKVIKLDPPGVNQRNNYLSVGDSNVILKSPFEAMGKTIRQLRQGYGSKFYKKYDKLHDDLMSQKFAIRDYIQSSNKNEIKTMFRNLNDNTSIKLVDDDSFYGVQTLEDFISKFDTIKSRTKYIRIKNASSLIQKEFSELMRNLDVIDFGPLGQEAKLLYDKFSTEGINSIRGFSGTASKFNNTEFVKLYKELKVHLKNIQDITENPNKFVKDMGNNEWEIQADEFSDMGHFKALKEDLDEGLDRDYIQDMSYVAENNLDTAYKYGENETDYFRLTSDVRVKLSDKLDKEGKIIEEGKWVTVEMNDEIFGGTKDLTIDDIIKNLNFSNEIDTADIGKHIQYIVAERPFVSDFTKSSYVKAISELELSDFEFFMDNFQHTGAITP